MEGFIIGRNFVFRNGLCLAIKTTLRKQPKTASTNSPWASLYIREGLLLEGFLRLRFGGLFSGGLMFLFCFCFVVLGEGGGGGGRYYRTFTVP